MALTEKVDRGISGFRRLHKVGLGDDFCFRVLILHGFGESCEAAHGEASNDKEGAATHQGSKRMEVDHPHHKETGVEAYHHLDRVCTIFPACRSLEF